MYIVGAQEVFVKCRDGMGWDGVDDQRKIFPFVLTREMLRLQTR